MRPAPASNSLLASTKQAEANIEKSVSSLVETSEKLEQDDMEGVDEKEWGKIFHTSKKEKKIFFHWFLCNVSETKLRLKTLV